ncbi:cysteine desulfurase family protein [Salininema proteolyticum]|uniref:Cysteine desulfurase family protein n=1 Tax=Salininema proteolyticum TaxID=1607685 RepID=A0ABV8TVL4_9ACTN
MADIYFDSASAMPPQAAARDAYAAALSEGWARPGRLYTLGRRSRMLLEAARASVAESIGARADEVVFTPSGSQAVHYGLLGAVKALGPTATVAYGDIEHSSVLHAAEWHRERGGAVRELPVDRLGRVDSSAEAGGPEVLVVQSANHEVGTRQSIPAHCSGGVADPARPWVCDAAASLPWEAAPEGWSVLAASPRKWGGLAGCGILVVRTGTRWRLPFPGDDASPQEAVGEINVPAAVAAAASLRHAVGVRDEESKRVRALTEYVRREVPDLVGEVEVPGDPVDRLPHIVTFSCLGVDGEVLLSELSREGFAVSSGSACASNRYRPSHVLTAMGVLSHGNVRLSFGYGTAEDDVERFLEALPEVVGRIRAMSRLHIVLYVYTEDLWHNVSTTDDRHH